MDKRESLSARSERVIGRSLEDANKISKPPRGQSQRREQVLQAQRAHRHRTQQYIRELEKEIFRLRDEKESVVRGARRMQSQINYFKETLAKHDLSTEVPLDMEFELSELSLSSGGNYQNGKTGVNTRVDFTELLSAVPEGSCENHPIEISPPAYRSQSDHSHDSPAETVSISDTQRAIDFILTLERPCLGHVKHAHLGFSTGTTPRGIDYNSGPGHVLTVSAGLARQFYNQNSTEAVLNVPSATLEDLMKAGARLQLDNEITPVQVWERLRETSAKISETELQTLIEEFSKYTYCNSFGAVVEKSTALAILADVFDDTSTPSQTI